MARHPIRRVVALLASLVLVLTLGGAVAGELATVKVELFYSGAWHDITADTRTPITIDDGTPNEGTAWWPDPGTVSLRLNNGPSNVYAGSSGVYDPDNPRSPLYGLINDGTQIRVSAALGSNPLSVRCVMELSDWSPGWDPDAEESGDVWIDVTASGITRRLGIPGSPLLPALQRASNAAVQASWPLASLPQDARRAPSARSGGSDAIIRPTSSGQLAFAVEFGADNTAPGLGAMPTVKQSQTGFGLTGQLPVGITEPFASMMWGRAAGDNISGQFTMWLDTEDTKWLLWVLWETPSTGVNLVIVEARDADGSTLVSLSNSSAISYDDLWHSYALMVEQDGSDAVVTVYRDAAEIAMSVGSGSLSGIDVGAPRQVRATGTLTTNAGDGQSVGYPTVLSGTAAVITAAVADLHTAGTGHVGETAGRRFERLCSEQGVAFTSTGDLDETRPMGPQKPARLVALLRECAKAEAAGAQAPIVREQQTALGLHFRTLRSFYITE
jgi:hypothetical protein